MEKQGQPPEYNPPPPAYPGNYNQQPGGYSQPGAYTQPGGYPQQQSTATVVVTGQPTVLVQQFRETPVRTKCPSCQSEIMTSTHYETGTMTWLVAGILCFIGVWFGLCCIGLFPFCINGCKDVVHTCPNCKTTVGRFNRSA